MEPSRRDVIALSAATAAAAALPKSSRAAPDVTMADAAKSGGLLFGCAAGPEIFSDLAYRQLIMRQCSVFVPQDSLKFDWLQPHQGQFNFATGDALVDAARGAGLDVRGHNLFWNDWLPAWVGQLSHAEIARVFDAHLDTVVPHFAGRLQSWDVVNEPFYLGGDHPGTYRVGPWYDALGPDYIFRAFRRTAELDPHVKLVLNEAWTERSDHIGLAVRASLLKLIDEIQHKGLKLDAIGLESHLTPSIAYNDVGFVDFLHEIAARRVEIYITELDIEDHIFPEDPTERDKDVADRASAYLRAVLSVPAVKMVIDWGLSDRYTWYRDPAIMTTYGFDQLPRPLPYDDMLAPKPMRAAMLDAFARRASQSRG